MSAPLLDQNLLDANIEVLKQLNKIDIGASYHIFFISNPICGLVSAMYAERLKIPKELRIVIPIRDLDVSCISGMEITERSRISDRLLAKIGVNSLSLRIRQRLNKLNKPYIVYAPWYIPHIRWVLDSPNCAGHAYLEEGQISHAEKPNFPAGSDVNKIGLPKPEPVFAEKKKYVFRDDAIAYIRIHPAAFPCMPAKTCLTLNNFEIVDSFYSPRLKGIKTIGIGPAPRRVLHSNFDDIFHRILDQLPKGSAFKLHPGFYEFPREFERFRELLSAKHKDTILLCDRDTLIEAEMMQEPKVLYGPQSSLQEYAKFFGSSYHFLQLTNV